MAGSPSSSEYRGSQGDRCRFHPSLLGCNVELRERVLIIKRFGVKSTQRYSSAAGSAEKKLAKSPHRLADSIYRLLSSCGTSLSKDRALTLLDGNKTYFAKIPKYLIAQGRMVDGPGSDLAPKKNLGPGWEFFHFNPKTNR